MPLSNSHKINFSCPPKIYLCPPSHAILVPGLQGCRSLLSIGWDNLQFYPDFALFSTLGGMNLDHDFVQVSKLNADQEKNRFSPKMEHFFPRIQVKTKKRSSPEMEHFFSRIQVDTYAQMHTRVKLMEGCKM